MKKTFSALAGSALVAGALVLVPASASAAPYCGIVWGSLQKTQQVMSTAPVVNVRSGQHNCFDRVVVDIKGPVAGYHVRYVDVVRQDGSGHAVPLRGGAAIQVIVMSPAYDSYGNATYSPANRNEIVNVNNYQTFRQVAYAGSFEGQTTFGVGVRARLPFRVFTLDGPAEYSRVVVDVAHYWQ
ncbi:hypothetical protein IEU95_08025 [Hoyosella rhizosphaerae]|uniref:AMIN-like domain-containing protein n=1 Tax=Hoyosella rhizosphaerae TaxID=1755582 RepID=A0A916XA51_9ACTN|nr:hypothetical protein [Hoyosella rhizosphaerae]MBN4926774.1 hypothetical protein [Hoyosella rhizosphaerae]GGC56582.1 hypothetical protein GCM10011410_06310 [Hoyosella rhizosphaerae]